MSQWLTSSYSVRKRYSYGITRTSLVQQKDSFIQKLALDSKRCSFNCLSNSLYDSTLRGFNGRSFSLDTHVIETTSGSLKFYSCDFKQVTSVSCLFRMIAYFKISKIIIYRQLRPFQQSYKRVYIQDHAKEKCLYYFLSLLLDYPGK